MIVTEPMIQVRFTITGDDGTVFTDAINLTPEQHAKMTKEEISAKAQERYDNWKQSVSLASSREPTVDDIDVQLAQLDEDRAQLEIVKSELAAKSVTEVAVKKG